jgi:ABC-type lipoprotein export system ATPase subunit
MKGVIMSNTSESQRLLCFQEVGKTYHTQAGDFRVLSEVNLEIKKGTFTVLTGASGSGKSTLLHLAAGLDNPTEGSVMFQGTVIPRKPAASARWRAMNIGIVFQFFQLLPTLRAIENVMLPMEFLNNGSAAALVKTIGSPRRRAMELLDMVGMADFAEKLPSQLSGGEQQRIAIARALANDPRIIFADEPTGNLDRENAEKVLGILRGLVATGTAVLMVTHDRAAAGTTDVCVTLADGRIA